MKFIFLTLLVLASFAFAQTSPQDAVVVPETPEPVADVKGPYVKPTPAQKARVHAAAKKAKKKTKLSGQKKTKAVKKTKKNK